MSRRIISPSNTINNVLTPPRIAPGSTWRTNSGRKAAIISHGAFGLLGYIEGRNGKTTPAMWSEEGKAVRAADSLDQPWQERKIATVDVYIGLDKDGTAVLSYVKPKPEEFIGLQKLTVTVKEGDNPDGN